jgi:hypothetical protein
MAASKTAPGRLLSSVEEMCISGAPKFKKGYIRKICNFYKKVNTQLQHVTQISQYFYSTV